MRHRRVDLILVLLSLGLLVSCGSQPSAQAPASASSPRLTQVASSSGAQQTLRLATTTSTADTGLLDAILPDFEQQYNVQVQVIAVGTGQAIELGTRGDVDVVLVHARSREDAFVRAGDGVDRRDVMYNDFVIVGPAQDPAGIKAKTRAKDAFTAIAAVGALFASRGDDSGTYTKEQSIWASAGITPTKELPWYKSLGQGMGETLIAANELGAYTLTDRGTFLATRQHLPNLTLLLGGATIDDNQDKALRNPYGVIPVNPAKHPGVKAELAEQFADWITSPQTQRAIGVFGKEKFGQPLFYPSAAAGQ